MQKTQSPAAPEHDQSSLNADAHEEQLWENAFAVTQETLERLAERSRARPEAGETHYDRLIRNLR